MRLLLTGFEPFGTQRVNPSQRAVEALAGRRPVGVELHTAILPVEHGRGPAALLEAFEQARPDAVICLGEAGRRARLSIERLAINLLDYPMADNAGAQVTDQPVVPGGPAAYFVTLPVRSLLAAVRAAGVPAELSLSAGSFLCNQVMYELLHHMATQGLTVPAGFIHLPYLPEQVLGERAALPSMSLETAVCGLQAAIEVLARELAPARAEEIKKP